jgi:EAL domain-containing protein (putative c-di-GMP-specific phosphodiesterase class I)
MEKEMSRNTSFSIDEIISGELVYTSFQPVVSIRKKEISVVEALSRGINPENGETIPPRLLIKEALRFGLMLEMDRLFRKKSFEAYAEYSAHNREHLLSINLDSSAVFRGFGSMHVLKTTESLNIDPSSVIIEILESDIEDSDLLLKFVNEYKKHGFMIALDDFGTGFSNWSRIIKLKPDIIKLDKSIIRGIDKDFFRQEAAGSLIRLAHNTGSLVIAEGVEKEGEALSALELGADFIQGFYFSKAVDPGSITENFLKDIILATSRKFIGMRTGRRKSAAAEQKRFLAMSDDIIKDLANSETSDLNNTLKNIPRKFHDIECVYLLDQDGIQISDTIVSPLLKRKKLPEIFHPDEKYTDQSSKDYFFSIFNGTDRYVSEPYISSATGNKCVTFSRSYKDSNGELKILCIDVMQNIRRNPLV